MGIFQLTTLKSVYHLFFKTKREVKKKQTVVIPKAKMEKPHFLISNWLHKMERKKTKTKQRAVITGNLDISGTYSAASGPEVKLNRKKAFTWLTGTSLISIAMWARAGRNIRSAFGTLVFGGGLSDLIHIIVPPSRSKLIYKHALCLALARERERFCIFKDAICSGDSSLSL